MSEFERSVPNSTPRSPIRQGSVPNSTGIGPQFDSSVPNSTGIGPQFDSSGSQFDSYRYLFERSVLIPSVPNSYPPVPIPGSGPWRIPSYVKLIKLRLGQAFKIDRTINLRISQTTKVSKKFEPLCEIEIPSGLTLIMLFS